MKGWLCKQLHTGINCTTQVSRLYIWYSFKIFSKSSTKNFIRRIAIRDFFEKDIDNKYWGFSFLSIYYFRVGIKIKIIIINIYNHKNFKEGKKFTFCQYLESLVSK